MVCVHIEIIQRAQITVPGWHPLETDLIGLGCRLANGTLKFSRFLNVQPKLRASVL